MENISEQSIRGYELHELLAQGGMGAVYRATQTAVDREVVVKKILPKYANQPEFIRRFEAEAKLVAQLDHLHIAPLFDYWRDPSGAYLVMRYLRGGTLRDSIRTSGPWSPRATVRLLNQIGSALAVAHRRNIVHRDIKPANILLDDDNNAYLTDFGIALEMAESASGTGSSQKAVSGSAGYISPEQINLQQVTPQADIYSMALVIYEMLTGAHPYPDAKSAIALFLKHVNEPLPPLQHYPQPVYDVLQKAAAKNPADRYITMLEFASAFKQAVAEADLPIMVNSEVDLDDYDTNTFEDTGSGSLDTVENPYKGLAAFQEGDADDFFGREHLISSFLNRMDDEHPMSRFLAVVGPSGSGKSSIVKAGLLPALRRGGLPNSETWFIVEMIPGTSPIDELEAALMRIAVNPVPDLHEHLAHDSSSLVSIVDQALPEDGSELVLVIDQFEETFTTSNEKEREHFLQSIYQAMTNPQSRLRVIITLRADFYDRPLGIQNFSTLMQQRTEVVIPLTAEELERAITGPARRVKVFFQQGLAAQIVSEVNEQPGVLPMLQYALTELFDRRDGPIVMAKDYQEIGGVLGALARRAEEMYQSLDSVHKEATRQLFLRLVTLGEGTEDTRRRALQSELASAAINRTVMQDIIELFSKARLLTSDRDPITRSPTLEVAHEALIREWATLRNWLDLSREDVRLQRMLSSSGTEWNEANNDDSFLLRGGRLVQFEDWAKHSSIALTEQERVFLQASIKERNRLETEEETRRQKEHELQESNQRRLRLIIFILTMAFIGGSVLLFAVFNQSQQAQISAANAQTSESNANRNASTAVIAQAQAQEQAANAQTQVALVSTAEAEANDNAATAVLAQADALEQANNAQTQAALAATSEFNANNNAATAVIAQENSELQANNAQTQAALAATSESNANNNAATAVIAQENFELQANNAQTQVALVSSAEAVANNNAATAVIAQENSELQAGIAQTQAALAAQAQIEAQVQAEQAQSLALASIANQFADTNSPLAIALALEANKIADPPLQAQRVLISVVYEGPRKFYQSIAGGILDVAVSPKVVEDDSLPFDIFTANEDGTISKWDATGSTIVMNYSGHTRAVNTIAISPDGRQLVSGGAGGRIILWDVATGEIVNEFLGHTGAINSVDFSDNGQRIVSGADDASAIVWAVNNASVIRTITSATGNPINTVKFSPNGNTLLVITDDAMRLWRFDTGSFLEFDDTTNRIRDGEFSHDGTLIVTSGRGGSSRPEIWDVQRRSLLQQLPDHTGPVNSVEFSADDKFVISASDDFVVILSSVASGDEIRRYVGHQNRVNIATFADNGDRVVSASSDGEMYLWDKLPTSRSVESFAGHVNGVSSIAQLPYNPNLFLSSADNGELTLWDGITREIIQSYDYGRPRLPQNILAVSPRSTENNLIIARGNDRIEIREYFSNQVLQTIQVPQAMAWVSSIKFSPDGSMILWGGGHFFRQELQDFTAGPVLSLWDTETGDLIHEYDVADLVLQEGYNAPITAVAFSPDGQEILSGIEDGRLLVWDTASGARLREFEGHADRITAIEFSPDGSELLTASNDRAIILWEYETGRLLRRFTEHRGPVNDVAFSPDGLRILSGSEDTRVIYWDTDTGNFIQRFSEQDTPITTVAFIENGQLALSGALDGSIVKREIDTARGLSEWAELNRYIPILSCDERQQFNLECDVDSQVKDSSNSTG